MSEEEDKKLYVYLIFAVFVCDRHISNFGRNSRIWWVLEKELLPIRCLFIEGKVGRNSIFNLLHIPCHSHKERLFYLSLHCQR